MMILMLPTAWATAQTARRVKFPSKDGVTITADMYEANPDYPWVVLFHKAQSSRGEFQRIAPKLNKLEVNCLAVDLRSGKESNFIINETYVLAKETGLKTEYLDSEIDMRAAIEKAYIIARKPVIIFGSSYSASLAMKLGQEMPQVAGVIAFSPGEYFGNKLKVQEVAAQLSKPTFVACGADEKEYVKPLADAVRTDKKIFFAPPTGGAHGAACLDKGTEGETEYWIQMINFIQTVKQEY
ncbi:MAG: alpha/beta hydrolase [Bacteroidetes bacterium]|nr:MAG: alpha/beta hydrolase [Bacteroidota bacterium]